MLDGDTDFRITEIAFKKSAIEMGRISDSFIVRNLWPRSRMGPRDASRASAVKSLAEYPSVD